MGGQQRRGGGGVLCPPLTRLCAGRVLSLTAAAAEASSGWRAVPPVRVGGGLVGRQRLGGGGFVGRQRRLGGGGGVLLSSPSAGHGLSLAAAAGGVPSWGQGTRPSLSVGGGGLGGRRRRGGAVLCPPPRGYNAPVSPDNNLEVWCLDPDNERGYLLEEWDEPGMGPHQVTRASNKKVGWKCRKPECGHEWLAQVKNRTGRGDGCPACAGKVPTATNNFAVWCGKNGREDLLEEWAQPGMRPQ